MNSDLRLALISTVVIMSGILALGIIAINFA